MTDLNPTFKEPFLTKVKHYLLDATSITWDGCHKIYICLDQESHKQQVEYEYDMVLVKGEADALNQLFFRTLVIWRIVGWLRLILLR